MSSLTTLSTPRLTLRPLRPTDAAGLFAFAGDPEVARYTTWDALGSLEAAEGYVAYLGQPSDWPTWGVAERETDRLIGLMGLVGGDRPQARAEVGYTIARSHWGRGLASEALEAVLRHAFTVMGLERVEAMCHPENLGSARVLEKLGMRFEGVLRGYVRAKGERQDQRLYAMLASDYQG